MREKYRLDERHSLFSEDSYQCSLGGQQNKQILSHTQKKKPQHGLLQIHGPKSCLFSTSPQMKRMSQTDITQYGDEPGSTLLDYRQLCELNQSANSSCDNSMDRRYSQLVSRNVTRNAGRLHSGSQDVRNYTSSGKKKGSQLGAHEPNESLRDP